MTAPRLFWTLLAILLFSKQAGAQVSAPCPQEVDPAVFGYPTGYIPFSEGGRSGNFFVQYLYLPITATVGPSKATYLTMPEEPRDRDNRRMAWELAAIDAVCTYEYYGPMPQDRIWAVHETWKYGVIFVDCSDGGGGGNGFANVSYDPYAPSSSSSCEDDSAGGGSGGGGDSGGGCKEFFYDYLCIDVWVDGVGWVEEWCGVAAICQ